MTIKEIKQVYLEYLRRKQTPDCEDIPTEVIVRDEDKQNK